MYSAPAVWQPWLELLGKSTVPDTPPLATGEEASGAQEAAACACMCGQDDAAWQKSQQHLAALLDAASAIGPIDRSMVQDMVASAIEPLLRGIFDDPSVYGAALRKAAERLGEAVARLTTPVAICANPADAEWLPQCGLPLAPDPDVAPGTLRIAVEGGWMEDGPSAWIDRLAVTLARETPC